MHVSDGVLSELRASGQLSQLAGFVSVVAAGSFTAAAKRTGVDKSQLSRWVRSLEAQLGVQLLVRTTRSVRPTDEGQRLYEAASGPLADVFRSLGEAGTMQEAAGVVRIGGPAWLSEELWTPLTLALRGAHPNLMLDFRLSDDIQDFVGQGFDLAVRLGNLPDSSLLARKVASWSYVLVASPEWAAAHPLQEPDDITKHWVMYAAYARSSGWTFVREETSVLVRVDGMVSVDSGQAIRDLVQAGVGPSALPDFLAWSLLKEGAVVHVLPGWRLDHEHGAYLVSADRSYVPKRVKVVREQITQIMGEAQHRWAACHP